MTAAKPDVLIVEDEHALASALGASVTRLGAKPRFAASGSKALSALSGGRMPDAMVLDLGLPDITGLDVLKRAFPDGVGVPVLIVTAHGSLENAIAAKRLGVAEYLTKPLDLHAFEDILGGLLNAPEADGQAGAERTTAGGRETLVGSSPPMQKVFREIAHACSNAMPVLITGASGTGKTLAARAVDANWEGGSGELAVMECGGVREETFESALRSGCSSLLLENIDLLPKAAQNHLLAELEREGSDLPRLLATCRLQLHEVARQGGFREDLYYRLRGVEIRLPDLAERRGDIPALAEHFLRASETGRNLTLSPEVFDELAARHWPGNVRELRQAIDYAASVCGGTHLLPQHLPAASSTFVAAGAAGIDGAIDAWVETQFEGGGTATYAELLDRLERALLKKLLRRYKGKPTHLAADLAMNRTTLRKRCERLGLRE